MNVAEIHGIGSLGFHEPAARGNVGLEAYNIAARQVSHPAIKLD